MPTTGPSFFDSLSTSDIAEIRNLAQVRRYQAEEVLFSVGDQADAFHIIDEGRVKILVNKPGAEETLCTLDKGNYFGEMGIFNKGRRIATVIAEDATTTLAIDRDAFLQLVQTHPLIGEKIHHIVSVRNEELTLKENLIDATGLRSGHLYVSIKGDPSLRETAFDRQRHTSVVDNLLPELQQGLTELLLHRSVFKVFVGMNNGEVRTSSVFDPFNEHIHTANTITDPAYVERHFSTIAYQRKLDLMKEISHIIEQQPDFQALPDYHQRVYRKYQSALDPLGPEDIGSLLGKLHELRNIPNFYLRNITISTTQRAVRMQFNCDGTHIVSAEDYHRFIEENT